MRVPRRRSAESSRMRLASVATRSAACLLLAAFCVAGSPAPLAAQSRITTSVDTTHATVGDRLTLTVTVEHAAGSAAAWPDSLDLAPFEVLDAATTTAAAGEGRLRSTLTLTLAAFELGELEVPSFDVEVVGPGEARETLATDAWGVEVASVGIDESGEIRDIRGPLGIPMSLLRIVLLALAPLIVIALLFTIARRLRSRRRDEPAPAFVPLERPAHELALEALAALQGAGMLERGEVKEYHIEVSDILRTYVERRFRVDALEMTTREVLDGLARAGVDTGFREGLGAFLEQCDMVKFAKVRPAPEASRQVLELGRRLVQTSAPRAEARASGSPGSGSPPPQAPTPDEVAPGTTAGAA